MTRSVWLTIALVLASPALALDPDLTSAIRDLDHRDANRRGAAQDVLQAAGAAAEAPLLAALPRLGPAGAAAALDVLGERTESPAVLAALLAASRSPSGLTRAAAARGLTLRVDDSVEAVDVLCRLASDGDPEVWQCALGGLRGTAPARAWRTLHGVSRSALGSGEGGLRLRLSNEALGRILTADPTHARISDVFGLLESAGDDAGQRACLSILVESSAPLAAPYLARIVRLGAPLPDEEGEAPEVRSAFERSPFDDPELWSAGLRAMALRGLGRLDPTAALPLALDALRDPDAVVRQAAIDVIPVPATGPDRARALEALVQNLVDIDHRLRRAAHERLRRATGADVPLSYRAWSEWVREDGAPRPEGEEEAE